MNDMANGGYWKSEEEWERVEAPLLEIEAVWSNFAAEFSLQVAKNHRDWPERSIIWGQDVRYLIQLYLADKNKLTFNLWLCASQDRHGERFWKEETLVKNKPLSEFKDALPALLREGKKKLESWSLNEFEFATRLAGK